MRDQREQKSDLPSGGRHTSQLQPEPTGSADREDALGPIGAYEKNLRFAAELGASDDPHKQELGRLIREGSSRIMAEWRATQSAKGDPRDETQESHADVKTPEAMQPRRSILEKARDLLGSFGFVRSAQPKSPGAVDSRSADFGLNDRAAEGGPYEGVTVPPRRGEDEATSRPAYEGSRISELEQALEVARREVSALRQDVSAVMGKFLIAGGMKPEAATKRANALLTRAGKPGTAEDHEGEAIEQLPEELRNLRREVALVMANLLIGTGCPPEQAREIAVAPLMPKSAKDGGPPEDFRQELEMQRFEQEVGRLCERIFGATEIRGQQAVAEVRPSAQELEKRPGPAPTRELTRDRGHEW